MPWRPYLFLRELLVEQRIGLGFRVQPFLAATQVIVVVAGPVGQRAAVNFDNAGGQRAQESAVVRDEDDAAGKLLEEAFQPVDGLDIQMVGGFVQQQDVGLADQCLRQQYASLHAAGQRGKVHVAGQFQLGENFLDAAIQIPPVLRLDLVLHVTEGGEVALIEQMVIARQQAAEVAQALCHHVEHAAGGALWHLLRQARDDNPALHTHLAVVRMQLAADQLQEGGFALAVAPDNTYSFVRFDGQIDPFEQEWAADAEVNALQLDKRHPLIVMVGPLQTVWAGK